MRNLLRTLIAAAALLCAPVIADKPYVEIPDHEGAHFFEVYQCGDLKFVFFVRDEQAAFVGPKYLTHPDIRRAAIEVRNQAKEEGRAYVVRNDRDCGNF